MPRQRLSKQEMADPGAADPVVVDAQKVVGEKVDLAVDDTEKVDGKKELAEDESDSAQDYRTRVEEAQLPDDVREAALCEVGKLARTSDQSPESGDIRTWLDTILDLPWSTKVTDSIDIQGSREVEATLRRLIEPEVADVEEADTAEIEPVVADVEEADTAEVERVVADVEGADTAVVERVVADVEGADTAVVERVVADVEGADTAVVERVVADVEGADTAVVERVVADVEGADTAVVERVVADVEGADTAEVERVVADVEGADTAVVERVVADVEGADTAVVERVVADVEGADTAPAGIQHDDTVEMPGVPALFSGGRHLRPQPPEQQVVGPEPVQTPAKKGRFGSLALAAVALAALLIGALLFASSRDGGVTAQSVPTVTATATATVSKPTSERSNESTGPGGEGPTIQLENLADSARPFQTVRIEGTYRGGPDTFLQVQRLEGGDWLSFPLPAKTDQSGQFTTYVELERPGRYWLRVVDPGSAVTSKPFVLVIEG